MGSNPTLSANPLGGPMTSDGIHVFLPELSVSKWAALGLPWAAAAVCVACGLWALRASPRRPPRAVAALACTVGLSALGLAGVGAGHRAELNRFRFSEDCLMVEGIAGSARLPFRPGGRVEYGATHVRIVSGRASVSIPLSGEWRIENLVVDARFLANEFRGRSSSAPAARTAP